MDYIDLIGPVDAVDEAQDYFEKAVSGDLEHWTFGWGDHVDRHTLGLERENLIVVAGENKSGKTTHAVNTVAENLALGHKVLVITTEISRKWYLFRLICRELRISLRDIRENNLTAEERGAVFRELEKFKFKPLKIVDKPHCTLGEIALATEREEPDIVVVDHFQRLDPEHDSPALGYKYLAQGLKELARDYDIPVMVLSQVMNDQGWFEYSDGEFSYHTQLMKTRWSRELIGEGDKVIFLHNVERDLGKQYEGVGHVIFHSIRDYESGGYERVRLNYNHQYVGMEEEFHERYASDNRPY